MSTQPDESEALESQLSLTDTKGALWQRVLEGLPLGVALLEAETGRTLWGNRAFQALMKTGTDFGDVIGLSPLDYLPGLSKADWTASLALLSHELPPDRPTPRQRLQFVEHATRNIAYWEWTLQAVALADDRPHLLLTLYGVSEIVMNERLLATAGRSAERARRRAESLVRLTQLVNASLTIPDLLRAVTQEAANYFDTPLAAVLLLTPDEQHFRIGYGIGLHPESVARDLYLPCERTLAARAITARRTLVLAEQSGCAVDTPLLADGSHPVTVISSPILHEERVYGVVEVYFEHAREVSEESLALLTAYADHTAVALLKADLYQQIEEQRRQLQSIVDNAPVAIVYFNTAGVAITANAAAIAHYGHPPSEVIGHHHTEFLNDTPPSLFESVCEGTPFHASHYVHRRPDGGKVICDVSLLPVRDGQGAVTGLLLLSFDVTELVAAQQEAEAARKSAEDALTEVRTTQSQMLQMEKMRAVGELASGVAHDFNNALMAILGYTELAEDDIEDPQALTAHLAIIKKAAQDASSTVQRLQRFARQRVATHGEPTDLNAVVKDVVELTRPRWRDAAQKEGSLYEVRTVLMPLPPIMGEPSGLREVLMNIVYNALNAMPHGGRLTLTTRRHGAEEVEVEIADTGIGMAPEVADRIFEPFFTTRGVEGSGLGLAVSWTIVQRHGGHIAVESVPGQGARFFVRLPVGLLEQSPRQPSTRRPAELAEVSVLVVDDEPIVASVLTSILSRRGLRVTAVNSAREALECLRQEGDAFRLILTDHGMPGMTGLQLIAETKRLYPQLPVLLLTGWGETVLQNHTAEALPDEVLGKPINQSDLLDAVHRVLNQTTAS